jgi:hypothetical protein
MPIAANPPTAPRKTTAIGWDNQDRQESQGEYDGSQNATPCHEFLQLLEGRIGRDSDYDSPQGQGACLQRMQQVSLFR